jgi:hypothetical protein
LKSDQCNLGTKAYYANQKFFKSTLVTKHSKLKLCRTVIRPIVTYTSETWVLKESIIQKLLVFERRIFGPTKENQIWRIKTNEKLDKLIKHRNIVNYIKYICVVHTVVLFQSLVGVYCQTQHVKD